MRRAQDSGQILVVLHCSGWGWVKSYLLFWYLMIYCPEKRLFSFCLSFWPLGCSSQTTWACRPPLVPDKQRELWWVHLSIDLFALYANWCWGRSAGIADLKWESEWERACDEGESIQRINPYSFTDHHLLSDKLQRSLELLKLLWYFYLTFLFDLSIFAFEASY